MAEIWKSVIGYENLYEVSNLGGVRSLSSNKVLKQSSDKGGYLRVNLYNNQVCKTFKVHRLVGSAFIKEEPNKTLIDHINGNRNDNKVENLRWCSNKENHNFSLTKATRKELSDNNVKKYGSHGFIKASRKVIQCSKNGIELKIWNSIKEASEVLGITKHNIFRVCNGQRISAGGYTWKFI